MKRTLGTLSILALLVGRPAPALADPVPFFQDPIGPMIDVTDQAADYQPASTFCVKPNVMDPTDQLLGHATDQTTPPSDPDCAASIAAGLAPSDAGPLYKGHVVAPKLCKGCRRLFFDYSQIPAENDPAHFLYYAHGHIYLHLSSLNPFYTVNPVAHSPNVKNFTNDKLVSPSGSILEQLIGQFDLHAVAYVGDTANYAHTAVQGPYYIGPGYLHCNRGGHHCRRIDGAYLDVNIGAEPALPIPELNEIRYIAGFNSGEATCLDNDIPGWSDGNFLYAGCADNFGFGATAIDPYAN